ncbi:MAG TPA: hypothetical protein VNA66_05225, partial [Gammaproteobacteria bacterium]|nr:hypothetical protein [Gammaproteobacteria bacterium]
LLVELGVSTLRTTRIERLQLWRQFQTEMRATDSRLIVVVERTEDLAPEVLHALDQLTAPDAVGNPGANLVLLGHGSSIHEHLAAPVLDSLRQRIRLRTELEPFTEAELQEYLRQQVAAAGGQYDRLFASGAVAALHRYSHGVARLANTLCESALDIAAIQKQKQLTGELVAKTAVTLLGLTEPAPAANAAPAAQAATPARASTPHVEIRPAPRPAAATPVIFERRAEPRMPPPPASAVPTEPRQAPPAPAAIAAPPPPPPPTEIEFDGGVTDVADVALADFPILTDAVDGIAEPPIAKPAASPPAKPVAPTPQASRAPAPAKTAAPAPRPASTPAQANAASPPAAPAAAKPAAKPAPRVEPSSSPPRPAAKPKPATLLAPTTTPLPHAAAAAAKPAAASRDVKANDAPRPAQPGRGIAGAKSIDDLSDLDAETLFADAELDLVSAALASAEWPDDDEVAPAKSAAARSTAAAPAPARAAPAKPAPQAAPTEDAFDLFGLDDNAPLELIDDSTLPPANPRKTASR